MILTLLFIATTALTGCGSKTENGSEKPANQTGEEKRLNRSSLRFVTRSSVMQRKIALLSCKML
ncbi:hypothetical protein PAV_3c04340 [Paenibacillus alvei DSM 29]|uniref:hypothetical protein n=1 Tax=Paenibacillus alvei TaxID=44250 RepID=UPI0002899578|nr:hypothetical protein PAV_3c04340 [Paenibacillus alvei DSM 29]